MDGISIILISIDIDLQITHLPIHQLSISTSPNTSASKFCIPQYIYPDNTMQAPTISFGANTFLNMATQTPTSMSIESMAAPSLSQELSLANSSDSLTACGAGHAHSLRDCIKHCYDNSTNDAAFGVDSSSGIQTRGRSITVWECCDCGEAGMTLKMISCTCGHTRCVNCETSPTHK